MTIEQDDWEMLCEENAKLKAERDFAESERIEWVQRGERAEELCNELHHERDELQAHSAMMWNLLLGISQNINVDCKSCRIHEGMAQQALASDASKRFLDERDAAAKCIEFLRDFRIMVDGNKYTELEDALKAFDQARRKEENCDE